MRELLRFGCGCAPLRPFAAKLLFLKCLALSIQIIDEAALVELLQDTVVVESLRVLAFGFRIHLGKFIDHERNASAVGVGTRLRYLLTDTS